MLFLYALEAMDEGERRAGWAAIGAGGMVATEGGGGW